jgi:hypothetical protein
MYVYLNSYIYFLQKWMDIFSGWFLGTWVSPSNLDLHQTNHGTHGSCVFQGFIIQLGGLAALLFNASLAVLYFLMVKYHWRESEERFRRVEFRLQIGLWVICSVAATLPVILDMYHNTGPICWIDANPRGCTQSWRLGFSELEETDCVGGDNATFVSITVQLVPLAVCVVADTVIMIVIYRTVRQLEKNSSALQIINMDEEDGRDDPSMRDISSCQEDLRGNQIDGDSSSVIGRETDDGSATMRRQKKRSVIVARRGILYIAGFLITFGLTFLSTVIFLATDTWNQRLDLCSYFCMSMQGVWSFLVFSREREMHTWAGRLLKKLTWEYAFGCRLWSLNFFSISIGTTPKSNRHSSPKSLCMDSQLETEGTPIPPIEGSSQKIGYGLASSMSKQQIVDGNTEFSGADYSSRSYSSPLLPSNDAPPTRPLRLASDVESTRDSMGHQQVPNNHSATERAADIQTEKIPTKSVTFAAVLNNFLFFFGDESPRAVGNNLERTSNRRHPFVSVLHQSSADEQKRPPNQPMRVESMRLESDALNDSAASTALVDLPSASSARQVKSARMPPRPSASLEDDDKDDDKDDDDAPDNSEQNNGNIKTLSPTKPSRAESELETNSENCEEEVTMSTISRRPRDGLIGRFRNRNEPMPPKLPKRVESGEECGNDDI